MRWLIRVVARLYPASWRARYGPEFDALLEDSNAGPGTLFDIMRGAVQTHFNRLNRSGLITACGILGMGLAGILFVATPTRYASMSTIDILAADAISPDSIDVAAQALSDETIARVIEKQGLYRSERGGRAADELTRFRENLSVRLAAPDAGVRPTQIEVDQRVIRLRPQRALHVSFTYPDSRKAQEVATQLGGLVVDKYLQLKVDETGKGKDDRRWMQQPMQLRIVGPPRQMLAGPRWLTVMTIGLGTGLLVGVAIILGRRQWLTS